jgi:hypothetical protein
MKNAIFYGQNKVRNARVTLRACLIHFSKTVFWFLKIIKGKNLFGLLFCN